MSDIFFTFIVGFVLRKVLRTPKMRDFFSGRTEKEPGTAPGSRSGGVGEVD
jgi:hypothetical protein